MTAALAQLIAPHPAELEHDIWFQEQARAERIANLLRIVYMLFWLPVVVSLTGTHPVSANIANVGVGGVWLVAALLYHFFLLRHPYHTSYKYLSTTFDVLATTAILFLYHFDMGYSTVLKAPPFMNYLAILLIAALRFDVRFPIFVGALSLLAYGGLLADMLLTQPVQLGTALELFTTPRINIVYQGIRLLFILVFALVGVVLVLNVRRLVRLRVEEIEKTLAERAEREKVQSVLERYFTPEIARYVAQNPLEIGGRQQHVTVLVSDLRGFTSISEEIGPQESVRLLKEMFNRLAEIVFQHRGTLDKFTGDGMLVSFGTPAPAQDDALRAVQAALEMVEVARELGGSHTLRLGVAVHSGDVIFGNIGSPQRMELTIIGDAVNTTFRIEALNKELGTSVLVSEDTYREIAGQVVARALPAREIRGKAHPVGLYAVEGLVSGS